LSAPAIRVVGLGKRFRLGEARPGYETLRDTIARAFTRPFRAKRRAARESSELWALRDVSFEVARGEVVGIIGRNGAGKSTLLKILSRITEPTAGEAVISGRVGSLLEVGTGFHPELTGRENIYLNGAILGMRRREIQRKFDEIVAFSEVERFIDTPMKHFSTGMYMRLAFAVAAHLEPEILLVDEVLAVGDAAFQRKCMGKMGEVGREGRTVLFVSHDMAAIAGLTRECLCLEGGRLEAQGSTPEVIRRYLAGSIARRTSATPDLALYRRGGPSDPEVRISAIWVNAPQAELPTIEMGEDFSIVIQLDLKRAIHGAHVACMLKDVQGRRVTTIFSWDQGFFLTAAPGRHLVTLRVRGLPIAPGQYVAEIGINQSTQTIAYDVILDYPLLEIVADRQVLHWRERPWGSVHWSATEWTIEPR
jgi:lipopolysaccharide transport system ATP-binding protein